MINQQLLDYIKQQLQQGVSQENIKNILLAQGWQEKDIEEVFNLISQSEQPVPGVSPVKTSKKPVVMIISVILGVIFIAGGVFGYFYYFQSPERIVQKMTEKMAEVKSLEYTGQITAEVETSNLSAISPLGSGNILQPKKALPVEQTVKFSRDFSGASDLHDLNKPKVTFRFDVNTDILPQTFGLEMRIVENIVYFKLSSVPDLEFFDSSFLKNQWIKIDIETIKKQFGSEKLEEQPKEAQKERELSPEQIEQIKEIATRTKVFKITEKLPSEKIDGINTHHYKFIIDKEGLIELFTEISKIIQNKSLTETELQELNESLQTIEMPEGEIWIGKKDLLLYKIFLDLNIKKTEKTKSEDKITILIQFKNYNKPVQIDVPTSVKTLKEVMGELFGGGLQNFGPGSQFPNQQLPGGTMDFNKDL